MNTMETIIRTNTPAAGSTAEAIDNQIRPREFVTVDSTRIIHDEVGVYIIATLSILWLYAQIRRFFARDFNAGCWYGWDAFALAVVVFFMSQNQYAKACVFTPGYFVWTRLPGSPFNDLNLPSFDGFVEKATLGQRAEGTAYCEAANTANDIQEDSPDCLVCWSTDKSPLVFPCNHNMCRECLFTMKDRQQTCCPLCRLPLFHDNDGLRCAIHKAVVSTFAARLTASGIYLFLQLWHEQYWEVAQSAATYIPQFYCFRVLHIVLQTQGVQWWQFGMFDYLMPLPVPEGRFWRSVWPPAIFTLLFSMGVIGNLHRMEKIDLIVERVVHREPFTQLYAS